MSSAGGKVLVCKIDCSKIDNLWLEDGDYEALNESFYTANGDYLRAIFR